MQATDFFSVLKLKKKILNYIFIQVWWVAKKICQKKSLHLNNQQAAPKYYRQE